MTSSTGRYPEVGDKAPNFTLTSLDETSISLSSYLGVKVIVFMWASW